MPAAELKAELLELKRERRALLLVHNYQNPEVQAVADVLGDSLELSRRAATAGAADVIVFCGVHFMAETAAILNPDKPVLLPDVHAGCPMADMVTAADIREWRSENPDGAVVCYVNSTAAVKAESDCCCTSANAIDIVTSFPQEQPLLFVPDQHLGDYVAEQTGRTLTLWPGYCPVHVKIQPEEIMTMREQYPDAVVMVHPECPRAVRHTADHVLSTGGMVRLAGESQARSFVVGTEAAMCDRLRHDYPDKTFHPLSTRCICPNMKKITLEKVVWSLRDLEPRIEVAEPIRTRAEASIRAMLERTS